MVSHVHYFLLGYGLSECVRYVFRGPQNPIQNTVVRLSQPYTNLIQGH